MMLRLIAQILELLQSPFKLLPPLDHNRLVVDLELAAMMLRVLAENQIGSVEMKFLEYDENREVHKFDESFALPVDFQVGTTAVASRSRYD
jgi:hypothetical protein